MKKDGKRKIMIAWQKSRLHSRSSSAACFSLEDGETIGKCPEGAMHSPRNTPRKRHRQAKTICSMNSTESKSTFDSTMSTAHKLNPQWKGLACSTHVQLNREPRIRDQLVRPCLRSGLRSHPRTPLVHSAAASFWSQWNNEDAIPGRNRAC